MSNTIDQRVVEMRFDNRHFESNVSKTMSTLEKLKQRLNLSDASKGLNGINIAAKNVNMSGLGSAVETVTARFSALQVMGVTALANITNSAVNAGKSIVKSLTIDPVKSGFSEYETKLGSIQTILANTEHQGTTLNDVTRALDELNLYADKTIYNFQEMTRNIGTFTAAGVDLDTSVRSIQGIANLAAVSGSTSQQASTAMYQLSQALATGTVKLMDWNSVVNAGMGGKVFQNALIQTAAMLNKSADDVEGWKKKNIDAFGSFRDSLTQGEWLTSEVLTKTLEQFTMAAEEGSAEWEKFKKSLVDDGYTEAQAESILKMANTATDAATKVKTFTQLMDTLKESAQSGWAQTWESIIGDFEEAKSFFTGLSDLFGGIIGDSANRRNTLITETMSSNWEKLTTKIKDAGFEAEEFEESIRKVVGDKKLDGLIEEWGSLEAAVKKGKISSDDLKKAISGLGGVTEKTVSGLSKITDTLEFGDTGDQVKEMQQALVDLGYDLKKYGVDGVFKWETFLAVKEFQKAHGIVHDGICGPKTLAALKEAAGTTEEVTEANKKLSGSYDELVDSMTKKSGRELLLESIMNIIHAIHRPLAAVGEAMRNVFSVSPEQLYNALEAFNKFTSKFVMKGALDGISTWDELTAKVTELGIAGPLFLDRLTETLKVNGVNVEHLKKKYGSLKNAFEKGAISMDIIKETLMSFDGVSESMLLGGESADKVRKAFEGLFAIIEIIGAVAGGGLRFAFEVLTSVLDALDTNILDLAANMGDAVVAFRDWIFEENLIARAFDSLIAQLPVVISRIQDWFKVFKQTPAIQKLVDAINAIRTAFNDLMSGDINIDEFATSLGTNLANALKSLPGIAKQIASDFIAGFTGGLWNSISGVIDKVVTFCINFVSAFAEALGVQSPSWKAYEIAVDFFQGFINGVVGIFGKVKDTLIKVGNFVINIFKDLWDSITDESGKIQWGKLIAGGIIVSVLLILKQFADAFSNIAGVFGGLEDVFENTAEVIKSFKKVVNSYAWDLKAKALQRLAIAIGILAASIWLIAQIDDPWALLRAVGTIVVLAIVVAGLAAALDKMSAASVRINGNQASISGLKTGLIQIGIVMALLAITVKMIGDLDPEAAKRGFIGLAGMAGGLLAFMAVLSLISIYARNTKALGSSLVKISVALILLVYVAKLVDGLSPEAMGKAVVFAGAFAAFVYAITIATMGASNNIGKVGGMILKLTIAMGLMVLVVKLASKLSPEEMGKGIVFAGAFAGFVGALVFVTRIARGQQLAKVGGLVMSLSISLMLMVGVCKLVGQLSVEDIVKGALFIAGFASVMRAFIMILETGSYRDISKVGSVILAFSIAISILAGVAILLSFVDIGSLAKGVVAVGLLSAMMALMVYSLKGAQNVKGAIMMMAVCIGVIAAAVVAMSFIPFKKLAPAVAGMSILMGVFAFMVKSMNKLKKVKIQPLLVLSGVIVILAGVVFLLQNVNALSAVGSAIAISAMLMAMAGALRIIGEMTDDMKNALIGIGVLAAIVVVLGFVVLMLDGVDALSAIGSAIAISGLLMAMAATLRVIGKMTDDMTNALIGMLGLSAVVAVLAGVIYLLDGIDALSAIGSAIALSALMLAMSGVLRIIDGMKAFSLSNALKAILALTLMAVPLLTLVGVLKLMDGVENATSSAVALIGLVTVLALLLIPLTAIGAIATTGVGTAAVGLGILALTLMVVPLLALVGVLKLMSGIEDATNNATLLISLVSALTGVLVILATIAPLAIMGVAAMGGLVLLIGAIGGLAVAIGALMEKFPSIQTFLDTGLPVLEQLAGSIGAMIGKFIGGIGEGLSDSLIKMGEDIATFMDTLKTASVNASGIDGTAFDGVKQLIEVMASIGLTTVGTSISDIFTLGGTSMEKFATDGVVFFDAMKQISKASNGITIDEAGFNAVISVATKLSEFQSTLEPIGGVIDWFTGRDDLATFGLNVGAFMQSMTTAIGSLNGVTVNTAALDPIISAAKELSELQSSLESIGGVISWFSGRDDLATFGTNIAQFIEAMKTALGSLSGTTVNSAALDSIISAAHSLADLQTKLEPIGGVISWFSGRDDLGTFGTNIAVFIESMKTALGALDGVTLDETALSSVISATERLSDLQSKLEPMGGVISWFSGRDDLGTFGTNIGLFADAMGTLKTKMGEDGMNEAVVTSVISAGEAIIALQQALPEEGWFDGKMNLSEFADYVTDFGQAMGSFASEISEIDSSKIDTSISTAHRIKSLIASLADLDASGLSSFAGVGAGDGYLVNIGQAIGGYGEAVANLNVDAVNTSVTAATRLKTLIGNLAGLDASGIDNFKIDSIGSAMQDYGDKVANIDTGILIASISSANRLKTFISGLVGLDTSGIANFNIAPIGTALGTYGAQVASVDIGAIIASVTAAKRVSSFITSLAGLDSSGVSSFKSAISELATVDMDGLVSTFAGKATEMASAARSIVDAMASGLIEGSANVSAAMTTVINGAMLVANTTAATFGTVGKAIADELANGIKSSGTNIYNAAKSVADRAKSGAREKYSSMYTAGTYLGSGLISGINSKKTEAYNAGYALGAEGVKGVLAALAAASPSRKGIQAGEWLGEGFVIGVDNMGDSVYHSGEAMGNVAVKSVSDSICKISDVISNGIDSQPTIRPVLDLSDVRAGAGAINDMLNTNPVSVRTSAGAINSMMNRRSQNGVENEVVSAIDKLRKDLSNVGGTTYSINGITYDDGSNIAGAVREIVRAARTERRV